MQSIIKAIAFLIFIALSVYFAEGQAIDFGMFLILILHMSQEEMVIRFLMECLELGDIRIIIE